MFNTIVKLSCHSKYKFIKKIADNLLEKFYSCEINCIEIDKSVLFAHHARGCTIVAAKICENVVIYQNVSIGANLRYNKINNEWENLGNPIICKNVIIADGAKILGPVVIGENTVIGAGSIITKNIPSNSIAFGVNQFKPKDENYDLIFNPNMPDSEKMIAVNKKLIKEFYNRE